MADVQQPTGVTGAASDQLEEAAKVLAGGDTCPKVLDDGKEANSSGVLDGSKCPPSTPIRSATADSAEVKASNAAAKAEDGTANVVAEGEAKKSRPRNPGFSRFPKFKVTWDSKIPSLMSVKSPGKKKRRNSLMAERFGVPMAQEMTPQATLVEFIVTSASYHGVKKQQLKALEDELFRVFRHNVMPANAAAWYMAKRRFYQKGTAQNQLLPMLLKEYPKKFAINNNVVNFMETYAPATARSKMAYLVEQGLYAYFSHKADEYGVYFFDPLYYEDTEPFHANLRIVTKLFNNHSCKLIPSYFRLYKKQFHFKQLSPYLVCISKAETEVIVGMTGIIVSVLDQKYGLIQFSRGSETCMALFSMSALFRDGYQLHGDPKALPPVFFDAFMVPNADKVDKFKWFAVLTWVGRKPNSRFCSTMDDLRNCPYYKRGAMAAKEQANAKKAEEVNTSYMKMGSVSEIRKNGAVAVVKDNNPDSDKVEKFFVPGWAYKHVNTPKAQFLTTTQGVGLSVGDLINFYIDPKLEAKPYDAVACNVDVLKPAEKPAGRVEKKPSKAAAKKKALVDWKKFLLSDEIDEDYNSAADSDYCNPLDSDDSGDSDSCVSEDEVKELMESKDKDIKEILESLPKEVAPPKVTEINENEPISKVQEVVVGKDVEVVPTA